MGYNGFIGEPVYYNMVRSCWGDMRYITAEQARGLDRKAQEEFAIPSLILMENAGSAVCEAGIDMMDSDQGKVVIFCGRGNNGGDGLVAARHLLNKGYNIYVYIAGSDEHMMKGDPLVNAKVLFRMNRTVEFVNETSSDVIKAIEEELSNCDLIIDCLFGIGLSKEVKEPFRTIIGLINKSGEKVLSVDIPSGIDADTGEEMGISVKADRTVTFLFPKNGLATGKGKVHSGDILIRDIGINGRFL